MDLKKKFRREEELTKTSERLYEVAFDIATHFTENFKGTKFKGQFAVSGKAVVPWLNVDGCQTEVEWQPVQSWLKLWVVWLGSVVASNSGWWHW